MFRPLLLSIGLTLALLGGLSAQPPAGFVHEYIDWVNGVGGATAIEFGPNERLYVAQKNGFIVVYHSDMSGGYGTPTSFGSVAVHTNGEGGLLGMALDPDFATNRHMFLFYTTPSDQKLIRVTASADYETMMSGSTVILLEGLPNIGPAHKAGDIHFRPGDDGALYVAVGDDDIRSFAASLTHYHGKFLKLNKSNGLGLASNPFYDGDLDSIASRVWAIGHRNPFRFAFHPDPAFGEVMYVSENGETVDRLSRVEVGSDGGWPTEFVNPPDPGHVVLQTRNPSLVGVALATTGPFADGPSPVIYLSDWLGGVRRYRLTGPELDSAVPMDGGADFLPGTSGVDMEFGPDGSLYMTRSGVNDGGDRILHRIRWDGGGSPTASFTTLPDPAVGPAPLVVQFLDQSTDSDGTVVGWSWNFGDGSQSSLQSPQHTFVSSGVFSVTLTVTDDSGLSQTSSAATVVVGDGCDDLSSIPEAPVDFATQVAPIFQLQCAFCHNSLGQLPDLSGDITASVVGVAASDPSWNYVAPGSPADSLLFQKINCEFPPFGDRMPIAGILTPAEQALIRDWITQLPVTPSFVRGDTNGDGTFDVGDSITALGFLFTGQSVTCEQACDANDDDQIDIGDAVWVLSALFASGPAPAAPHPDCGVDPSPSSLSCDAFAACE